MGTQVLRLYPCHPLVNLSLNPEHLTLLDPACGSGHIVVKAYDLVKAIYQEQGYRARDIPALILQKNLFGQEIDDRAAQLAAFALPLTVSVQPHVMALVETKDMDAADIRQLIDLFAEARSLAR